MTDASIDYYLMLFFDMCHCYLPLSSPNYFIFTHRESSLTLAKLRTRHVFLATLHVSCSYVLEAILRGILHISCVINAEKIIKLHFNYSF